MKRDRALWAGVLIGPIMWFSGMETNFAIAPLACGHDVKAVLFAVSLVSFVATAAGGWLAWSEWQRLGRAYPGELGGETGRSRAMALGGVLLSAMFSLTIVAQAIPNVILAGCE